MIDRQYNVQCSCECALPRNCRYSFRHMTCRGCSLHTRKLGTRRCTFTSTYLNVQV
ncbi:Protein of unknown function [Pyronema omphalodes CBS 100304]|uniref:Uncharacterized protein n=1 Tax=Pyronema omphalodes (strain CBS 100304) TaxID=1076935 RepID=U4L0V4_PYROM|nr:Protein of unknown function [Pyronema omphalodes CBS 100304]